MDNLHFMGLKVAPSCACVSQFLRELYHDPLFSTFLLHSKVCRQGRSTTRCNNVEYKALKFFQHLTELWWNYEIQITTSSRITVGIVYQFGILSLSCSQYSQTICLSRWDDNTCLGVRNTCSIGAWPNSLDWRPPWYCIVSPLLQTNKQLVIMAFLPVLISI